MEKMNVNDLRQSNGVVPFTSKNVEVEKNVKEIIAHQKELNKIKDKENPIVEEKSLEANAKVEEKTEVVAEQKAYVAHGALPPENVNNIEAVLKRYHRSPYDKYTTTAEYMKAVSTMNTNQLHEHAVEVNVIPTSDKEKLVRNLENAYGVYINKHAPRIFPPSNLTVQNKDEIERVIASKMPRRY